MKFHPGESNQRWGKEEKALPACGLEGWVYCRGAGGRKGSDETLGAHLVLFLDRAFISGYFLKPTPERGVQGGGRASTSSLAGSAAHQAGPPQGGARSAWQGAGRTGPPSPWREPSLARKS